MRDLDIECAQVT